jgi:peroxiredoxin Q/BCP
MKPFLAFGTRLACYAAIALHTGCGEHEQSQPTATPAAVTLTSTRPRPATPELALGSAIPELPVVLQDGFKLDLRALKGKVIVLYFCPAASDPECVRESQGLGERYRELHDEHHVAMVGVSRDDAATHEAFIAQHALPFDFASDADGALARAYHVPASGLYSPRVFLIGRDNLVRATWSSADPETHLKAIFETAK